MSDLVFERQIMGRFYRPTLSGYTICIWERIHPQANWLLKDGEILLQHEMIDDEITNCLITNRATWEYLAKEIFGRHPDRWRYFDQMGAGLFSMHMQDVKGKAERHFQNRGDLLLILNWILTNTSKFVGRVMSGSTLSEAQEIVWEANRRIEDMFPGVAPQFTAYIHLRALCMREKPTEILFVSYSWRSFRRTSPRGRLV